MSALAAVGLGFLRKHAILLPLMLGSLAVARWGVWRGFRRSRRIGPLLVGAVGGASLASGVMLVHGFPAMQMIYAGGVALAAATWWNAARRSA